MLFCGNIKVLLGNTKDGFLLRFHLVINLERSIGMCQWPMKNTSVLKAAQFVHFRARICVGAWRECRKGNPCPDQDCYMILVVQSPHLAVFP